MGVGWPGVRVLISQQDIRERVAALGREISQDYWGRELVVIGVLKGAVIFLADLVRTLTVPTSLDFMAVSSYGDDTHTSGVVRIIKDLDLPLAGRHVLLVEDIVDSGLTLRYLLNLLQTRGPTSLNTCVLLDKPARRQAAVVPNYVGFTIPDVFVVGYGLDYAERYRHLPYLAVLETGE